MSVHFLHLNPDKVETLLIGPDDFSSAVNKLISISIDFPVHFTHIKSTAKDLADHRWGIVIDQHLTFDQRVTFQFYGVSYRSSAVDSHFRLIPSTRLIQNPAARLFD